MTSWKSLLLISVILLSLFNCTAANYWNVTNSTNNTNPMPEYNNFYYLTFKGGWLFHFVKAPGSIGNAESKLVGKQCSYSMLYLIAVGDSSIESAVKDGKITKIATVSYEQLGILSFVYHRFCTIVTGE
ncbi:MAG TPA: TRL-like family protein [Leptospiraceae bacterium]|nr:TRL-like family protein [Leptospiraceae bacterium]HMX33447.1 TRL-like family protein [Leptospiraceae bacterium]HMY30744.1 TRL-like family protein [Leptospiraceae bacterium]HMZ64322.1 TRL-like family protein [Leptospiraceae bacterium]HNA08615.1 TRL-like family protein [Leptospiraceae bacterium]